MRLVPTRLAIGGPGAEPRSARTLSHRGLHRVRLLCVHVPGQHSAGPTDPRGQSDDSEPSIKEREATPGMKTTALVTLPYHRILRLPGNAARCRAVAPDRSLAALGGPHLLDAPHDARGDHRHVPAVAVAILVFQWYAVTSIGLCILACLATEAGLNRLAGKPQSLGDYSAVLTGLILGLSLPWSSPWYVAVVGSLAAIGLGKAALAGWGATSSIRRWSAGRS
jgi:hypothetical protein